RRRGSARPAGRKEGHVTVTTGLPDDRTLGGSGMDSARFTRRDALILLGAGASSAAYQAGPDRVPVGQQTPDSLLDHAVARPDTAVAALLEAQVSDPASPWRGSVPDQYGLHSAGSAGAATESLAAAFVQPRSRFHGDTALLDRLRLSAGFLIRSQSP